MSVSGSGNYTIPCRADGNLIEYNATSYSKVENQAHNNMPPYITAYCWRRYR